jgi:nicotinate-nucleotide pyrophosphorylase (carboxylating)
MALIKDNHIHVTRHTSHVTRLKNIIEEARRMIPVGMKLEIEVRNLREFKEALEARPDVIMLDNMKVGDIKKAVLLRKAAVSKIEVSGNVNLNNVRKIAKTGVDMISVGALTHSVKATDISLEIL